MAGGKRWKPDIYLQTENVELLTFEKCVVKQLQRNGCHEEDYAYTSYTYDDGKLYLKPANNCTKLFHPPECPLLMLKECYTPTLTQRISLGVAVFVQSSDDFIFLTRRSKHMRLFPGVWVPPGGHIERGETLLDAGVRELQEETGIKLSPNDFEHELLCLFESCYPSFKEWGQPSGHHVVAYYLLKTLLTRRQLDEMISLEEGEVDASVWLTKKNVQDFVQKNYNDIPNEISQRRILDGKVWQEDFNKDVFSATVKNQHKTDIERISTGTRFALECYVKLDK